LAIPSGHRLSNHLHNEDYPLEIRKIIIEAINETSGRWKEVWKKTW
jgi:hypothetical protein